MPCLICSIIHWLFFFGFSKVMQLMMQAIQPQQATPSGISISCGKNDNLLACPNVGHLAI